MEDDGNNNLLEKRILKVIERIRKSRARPCYQNIPEKGSNNIIEMDKLKRICNDLYQKNIISKKGKKNKESFYISDEKVATNERLITE